MVVADSTNGVSARLPILEWWSIPTTLSVTVERAAGRRVDVAGRRHRHLGPHGPRGARTRTDAGPRGVLAHAAQPLLVSRR